MAERFSRIERAAVRKLGDVPEDFEFFDYSVVGDTDACLLTVRMARWEVTRGRLKGDYS